MNRFSPLRLAISPRWRRVLSLLALVCYVGVAGGFPLPQPRVVKSSGERFPCQSHACGCTSAAQCWHDCCCMTMAQRVAWAESNGVAIPDDVRPQLVALLASPKPACCAHRGDPMVPGKAVQGKASSRKDPITLLLPQFVRHCRGLATTWISCGAVTPPPARTACGLDWPLVEWLIESDSSLASLSERPDVPPPRA